MSHNNYFHQEYETSRAYFRAKLPVVQEYWTEAFLNKWYAGLSLRDNSTDIITAEATDRKEKLLIITAGEHGIEGYPGSAALSMFIDELLVHLDPKTTGLRLIHAVNPWGMRHKRRVTENNIDLNRNFQRSWENPPSFPALYSRMKTSFVPGDVNVNDLPDSLTEELKARFTLEELKQLKNSPQGQLHYENGLYYAGNKMDATSQKLALSFTDWASAYDQILHIDLHTGGGPENELSIIFPDAETRSVKELEQKIAFPYVYKSEESINLGDSTANLHQFLQKTFPKKRFTSCLFEMGTIEENLEDLLFCTRTMINENYLYFQGAGIDADKDEILSNFHRLFYPDCDSWRKHFLRECYKGFLALLSSEKYLKQAQIR